MDAIVTAIVESISESQEAVFKVMDPRNRNFLSQPAPHSVFSWAEQVQWTTPSIIHKSMESVVRL
jgi:hypothetical protein